MKNLFITLVVAVTFAGCAYQEPYVIAQPAGPSYVVVQPAEPPKVVQPEKPTVVPPAPHGQVPAVSAPPQVEVWRPDPTAGIVQNTSRNVFVKLWIDTRPPSPPTLELGPEQAAPVYVSLGSHTLYIEGWIITPTYGQVSVGTASRTFDIRNWSGYYGGYAWRIYINDGDFGR